MTALIFQIAVRDRKCKAFLFRLQSEEITNHEQAIALTKQEFPDALAVFSTVPSPESKA